MLILSTQKESATKFFNPEIEKQFSTLLLHPRKNNEKEDFVRECVSSTE